MFQGFDVNINATRVQQIKIIEYFQDEIEVSEIIERQLKKIINPSEIKIKINGAKEVDSLFSHR